MAHNSREFEGKSVLDIYCTAAKGKDFESWKAKTKPKLTRMLAVMIPFA